MSAPNRPILVLALGNDLLGDDGVGLAAARILRGEFQDVVEMVESSEAGLALMEMLEGYERVLLLDAVVTGGCPPGTVLEFSLENFQKIVASSPHYAGLPEVLAIAEQLEIAFPRELCLLAMEVESPYELHEGLSLSAQKALPTFVERARQVLQGWRW
ncbi:MAG: hydrogenase maturation protease [Acidobacteria bacterium]|nr:hydrogenase maturation protease [Acidobacteriota bacterium]